MRTTITISSEWVRLQKISEIKKLQGKLAIDDNLQVLREKEVKKQGKLRVERHTP